MPASPLKILCVIPPMTQLNTPYPSTAYLTGFLRSRGISAVQEDLALALMLSLFSRDGLLALRESIRALPDKARTPRVQAFEREFERYLATIEAAVAFLQGRDPSRWRIASPAAASCPKARASSRSTPTSMTRAATRWPGPSVRWACRTARATWPRSTSTTSPTCCARRSTRASSSCATPNRWRRASPASNPWPQALAAPPNLVDRTLQRELTWRLVKRHRRRWCCSRALPGRVYGAFRIAQAIKAARSRIVTVLGGGFVNTELRELAEPRVFDHFDYVTLDAGERPLLALLEHLQGRRSRAAAGAHLRARRRLRCATSTWPSPTCLRRGRHAHLGRPAAGPLPVAAGHAQPHAPAVVRRALEQAHRGPRLLLEEVQLLRRQPGLHRPLRRGAAPRCWSTASRPSSPRPGRPASTSSTRPRRPRRCKALARRAAAPRRGDLVVGQHPLREDLHPELCQQLADSGCIAISGGLEVASDRLLAS
jgi:hypothetical protein